MFLPHAPTCEPPRKHAVTLVDLEEPSLRHYRSGVTVETREIQPQAADGPVPLSLVSVERDNLDPALRAPLAKSLGPDRVAPPDAFGTGPDVGWRSVM
ncbi:hypothetical protein SAMN05421539_10344 [Jannaschia seohaensis]|uniref:Uncharacterized protein n=1 Tax=Jannaschia seohaensis TaxID=475081 RepID=A0A2Y9AP86_9RHOB|nr:hypothetical protein BCF38_10344 [Jannaschia seohaensis]SSA44227.1 hypothetical protein SAMN05421539_10344 [Jannaschia seohaensis]